VPERGIDERPPALGGESFEWWRRPGGEARDVGWREAGAVGSQADAAWTGSPPGATARGELEPRIAAAFRAARCVPRAHAVRGAEAPGLLVSGTWVGPGVARRSQ
jgi:hypothetical protein